MIINILSIQIFCKKSFYNTSTLIKCSVGWCTVLDDGNAAVWDNDIFHDQNGQFFLENLS